MIDMEINNNKETLKDFIIRVEQENSVRSKIQDYKTYLYEKLSQEMRVLQLYMGGKLVDSDLLGISIYMNTGDAEKKYDEVNVLMDKIRKLFDNNNFDNIYVEDINEICNIGLEIGIHIKPFIVK